MLKPCLTCGRLSEDSRCAEHARGGSTRRWRRLRENILARDGYRCQLCGAPAVDHVVRVIDGGSDDPGNLRSLCSDCHGQGHGAM
jgi:5-methylcytosine-specific restriction protein A